MARTRLQDILAFLTRNIRRRLIAPMTASRKPPEFVARGVGVGVFFAFTPLVGIQIPIVIAFWTLAKTLFPRWQFSVLAALAWIWVTNVATVPPVYYSFILTGQVMLGRWGEPMGYRAYSARLERAMADIDHLSWWEELIVKFQSVMDAFGLPLFIGWVPWAIILSIVGYHWSLVFVRRMRAARDNRRRQRRRRILGRRAEQSEP